MSKVFLDRVLEIALAEVGYLEKASSAQLDDKTANAGSKNYTKYARDLYAAGYYNGNKNGYDWCDVFVDWCFWMAAGCDKKAAEFAECQTGTLGAGCNYSAGYYRSAGRFFSQPQAGDQIFFGASGHETHTGLVRKVENGRVYTVEGNTSAGSDVVIPNGGAVACKSYAIGNSKISGYGRPIYDEEEQIMITMTKEELEQLIDERANAVAARELTDVLGPYIYRIGDLPHPSLVPEVRKLLDTGCINGGTPYNVDPDDINLPYAVLRAVVMASRYADLAASRSPGKEHDRG